MTGSMYEWSPPCMTGHHDWLAPSIFSSGNKKDNVWACCETTKHNKRGLMNNRTKNTLLAFWGKWPRKVSFLMLLFFRLNFLFDLLTSFYEPFLKLCSLNVRSLQTSDCSIRKLWIETERESSNLNFLNFFLV